MAYILSTPTKRSAVVNTQAIFMIVVPLIVIAVMTAMKIFVNKVALGSMNVPVTVVLYLGMYLLVEALAGICYLGSCLLNENGKALAFGGGITVWYFIYPCFYTRAYH